MQVERVPKLVPGGEFEGEGEIGGGSWLYKENTRKNMEQFL